MAFFCQISLSFLLLSPVLAITALPRPCQTCWNLAIDPRDRLLNTVARYELKEQALVPVSYFRHIQNIYKDFLPGRPQENPGLSQEWRLGWGRSSVWAIRDLLKYHQIGRLVKSPWRNRPALLLVCCTHYSPYTPYIHLDCLASGLILKPLP